MANWKLFIARRIYRSNDGKKEVSKPAMRIAISGIAVGLAVMIVSVSVVLGFKHQVRDKVVGLGSDIILSGIEGTQLYQMSPVVCGDSLMHVLKDVPLVSHVQRYSTKLYVGQCSLSAVVPYSSFIVVTSFETLFNQSEI